MPLPVDLQDVVEYMDTPSDEMTSYINRKTGALFSFSQDDMLTAESAGEEGLVPDWQSEIAAQAKEVEDSDDWLALPDRFAIHEYAIMERYCLSVSDPAVGGALSDAIRGRGAFRRFKDLVYREGLADDWYAFRDRALRRIAAEFLEMQGIPYSGDEPPPGRTTSSAPKPWLCRACWPNTRGLVLGQALPPGPRRLQRRCPHLNSVRLV